MSRCALIAAALAACAFPFAAQAQDIAITNATVATGDGGAPIEHGTVVVRGGKVVAAGAGVAVPAGIQTVDGTGKWVTPGLFTAMTDLGLWDVGAVSESNDTEADESPFNAALDVAPALNPSSQHIAISRAGGVTRATVAAFNGNSIFAGQGAVIDLADDAAMVMKPRAFQFVELGEAGAKLAGGSRVAAHVALRNALREAKELAALPAGAARQSDAMLTRPDAMALARVLDGSEPLYVGVERAADIRAVLALRSEFPKLKLVLVGAAEGWLVASEIAAAHVPVITMPLRDLPAQFEMLAATQSNVGRMAKAGVKVAIGMFTGGNQPRYASQQAGNLVALARLPGAAGLTWGEAFAAISSVPAEISGFGGKAGVLAPGAVGDVVLWDGDPLELSSAPVEVWIDGVEQPLENHQTRLRDRYKDLDKSVLPKAYDW
ncbi:amidohydrolase family protein [Novosphingobium mangrovi (ex Huang et al. 2023)]|uniref:Amidohydrolase family protein n=1 Tax=Novosphingobium mangrovi (ex Huang et al. 2023) TaxID=2976432 RepID=A0ABT2I1B1_9SPHN|nr:amidohydrolase family protein [Novosphingobium mangrovi (ex Huang et al. 2023)]MCT2398586.1 amidohydrolase family protein [Novosphingobium mangrovi (ex Huang et al. 2023)]